MKKIIFYTPVVPGLHPVALNLTPVFTTYKVGLPISISRIFIGEGRIDIFEDTVQVPVHALHTTMVNVSYGAY